MTLVAPSPPENSTRGGPPDWVVLVIACVAQFMVVLDASVVNVALPSIARDLSFSAGGLAWTVNAYVLTFAGFLLLGGRAADLFGQRRVYLAGIAVFTVASLAGGLATDPAWLISARALQGVGGALLSPATLTIIVTTYRGERAARAIGVWSAVAAAGGATGALIGGILTAELSWRWIFFVNLPIGAAAVAAAVAYLPEARSRDRGRRLDVSGALAVTAGTTLLVYGIVSTDSHGWASAVTVLTMGGGLALLAAFVVIERRGGEQALIPLDILRSRSLSSANVVMLLIGASFFSFWYFSSLYLQDVLGYSALRTGFAYVPWAMAVVAGAQSSSRMVGRFGPRPLILIGTVGAAVGFVWFSRAGAHGTFTGDLLAPGLVVSAAMGLMFTPLAAAATAGVPAARAGLASGLVNTARQMGGSLGLAVLATIAGGRTRAVLAGRHAGLLEALASGYSRAFVAAGVLAVMGLVAALAIPGRRSP